MKKNYLPKYLVKWIGMSTTCLLWMMLISTSFMLTSCHYSRPIITEDMPQQTKDSLTYLYEHHYTLGTNFELIADSINLASLPLKESRNMIFQGDRVVVAEFAVDSLDTIDHVLVKLAHSQEVQGWVHECELKNQFAPTEEISIAINLFRDTHTTYFLIILALFVIVWIIGAFRKDQLKLVYFNDIASTYPLFLCLLISIMATLYETIQKFCPDTWEHFYYNPTLSPFQVPLILGVFLSCFWLSIVMIITALSEAFKYLNADAGFFYLLGLAAVLVMCYFFFIYTTKYYIGYIFLAVFFLIFIQREYKLLKESKYRCGKCGQPLSKKGVCPHCGTINN